MDLGRLAPGQKAEARLALTNRSPVQVRLDRVESSCPCVRVSSLPAIVESGGQLELGVKFDPNDEPDFGGRLAVDLTGLSRSGDVLFRTTVDVTVAEAAPLAAGPSVPMRRAPVGPSGSSRLGVGGER